MATKDTNNDKKPAKRAVVPKTVARGKAIVRTDDELDEMCSAEAMEAMMDEAASDWKENAPREYKTLLDSKEKP